MGQWDSVLLLRVWWRQQEELPVFLTSLHSVPLLLCADVYKLRKVESHCSLSIHILSIPLFSYSPLLTFLQCCCCLYSYLVFCSLLEVPDLWTLPYSAYAVSWAVLPCLLYSPRDKILCAPPLYIIKLQIQANLHYYQPKVTVANQVTAILLSIFQFRGAFFTSRSSPLLGFVGPLPESFVKSCWQWSLHYSLTISFYQSGLQWVWKVRRTVSPAVYTAPIHSSRLPDCCCIVHRQGGVTSV